MFAPHGENARLPRRVRIVVAQASPDCETAAGVLAVIPARDEAGTVASVVTGVRAAVGCPVLVVDDGSADGTAVVARRAGAVALELPAGLGAWGATQAGIRWARRHGYTGVFTLDADGQHLPESLEALLQAQRASGANVVIGTCIGRLSRAKKVAWLYLRLLTGLGLADFTSGLRYYDARAMELLAGPEASLLDYQDVGVLMLLAAQGLQMTETPVAMLPRQQGHSRVFASWAVVARYMLHTTILCLARAVPGRRALSRRIHPC